jgi:hypothetical protein
MHLSLIMTVIITFPFDQVFQAVVAHAAVKYLLDLILSSPSTRVRGGGGAGHQPGMGSGDAGDSLTTGKTW